MNGGHGELDINTGIFTAGHDLATLISPGTPGHYMATISGWALVKEDTEMLLHMFQNGLEVKESRYVSRGSAGNGTGYEDDQGSRTLVSSASILCVFEAKLHQIFHLDEGDTLEIRASGRMTGPGSSHYRFLDLTFCIVLTGWDY